MKSKVRNIGVNSAWWKGYQLIVMDEAPGEIPPSFLQEFLVRCREENCVSLELCVFSREDQQRLSVGFILRCEGGTRYEVQGTLDDLVQSLLARVEQLGFRVHLAEENDPVQTDIGRFFGGEQSPYHMAMGFFPGEKLLGPRKFYLPGRYGAGECRPLSWEQLSLVLTRYPLCMMCVQLTNTALTQAETAFLQNNTSFFAGIQQDQYAAQARGGFKQLLSLQGKRLFFASLFCVGGELFIKDVQATMRTWEYESFAIGSQELQKPDYLFFGDGVMKACTVRSGHSQECARLFPPRAPYWRLTHLITPEEAAWLFPLPGQPSAVSGIQVKRVSKARP